MSIINNGLLLASGADAAVGYQISRSLRFNSADSAYLSRTPGSAGNRKTWTWSAWLKRSELGSTRYIFGASSDGFNYNYLLLYFTSGNALDLNDYVSGHRLRLLTTQVFRDTSAWYHIVIALDTTQATASNRCKMYVNGVQVTTFQTETYPSQNTDLVLNSTDPHYFGTTSSTYTFNGYIADAHLVDGQALTPSDFAETNATTGQWVPKAYTGSYGTNGFRLTFSDNSGTTSTTLGKDAAGSNNWTPNNFSVASGSGNDSLTDSPTSYGTSTGVGGEVRGNYATLNPLINPSGDTFSNGNLQVTTSSSNYGTSVSTIAAPSSGKWYAEVTITATATYAAVGICSTSSTFTATSWIGSLTGVTYYGNTGNKYINGTGSSYGATFGLNDVIGIAYDADNLQITFYKNGSSQGTITGVTAGTYYFGGSEWDPASGTQVWNFGQRAFAYTAPSGFKALVDTNLTTPTIAKPANYFDAKLYTGNGSTQTISGLNFGPEFVWYKHRSAASSHGLFDAIRGTSNYLTTNSTGAEQTVSGVTAFTSDGFTLGTDTGGNGSGTWVAWCWDAASSNSTNTQGSITSTVRANATAGFSIVTYTGNGSAATVGHGLNALPSFFVIKNRSGSPAANNWYVGHTSITWTKVLTLNTTDAASTGSDWTPTSTLLTIPSGLSSNGITYVAYAFAPVANYSAISSWTGNGSSDGPFVFTGHRTRFLLYKRSDVANDWYIMDTARDTYNVSGTRLFPNLSNAEYTYTSTDLIDVTANGFKIRSSNAAINANGGTYIFMALAENPFQYARAR